MNYDEFLSKVKERTDIVSDVQGSTVLTAILNTLAERITPEQRHNLASQLPEDLKHLVIIEDDAETFGLDDFYNRVSQRLNTSRERTGEISEEVLLILSEAVSQGEIDNIKAELPEEFYQLFEGRR